MVEEKAEVTGNIPANPMPVRFDYTFDRLLKGVSRSFYLTMRVLPGAVRPQIGLAYLLARATDTIADTELVPVADRLRALSQLRDRILGRSALPPDLGVLMDAQNTAASRAERLLLERVKDAVKLLDEVAPADRERIRSVLDTITGGQTLDLERFDGADATHIAALRNDAELEDYTYRVAGCVGEFWTKTCRAHLFPQASLDDGWLVDNGIRFGKGLQLVNILRDIPADLRTGRCYIPSESLTAQRLLPSDLLNPGSEEKFRPLYRRYLELASAHLAAGWAYTVALPFGCIRLRLACSWPLLIGAETIGKLKTANVLDGAHRVKVSRSEVRSILFRSLFWYPCRQKWSRLFTLSVR